MRSHGRAASSGTRSIAALLLRALAGGMHGKSPVIVVQFSTLGLDFAIGGRSQ